jgi:hypothetical protein
MQHRKLNACPNRRSHAHLSHCILPWDGNRPHYLRLLDLLLTWDSQLCMLTKHLDGRAAVRGVPWDTRRDGRFRLTCIGDIPDVNSADLPEVHWSASLIGHSITNFHSLFEHPLTPKMTQVINLTAHSIHFSSHSSPFHHLHDCLG